ncbi:MAG: radical SAM protein [Candidatus Methanoperedens sp.]
MKVLLINPPSGIENPILPLGLGYIAAVLEKNDIDVKVIDATALHLNQMQLVNEIISFQPDIVGVSIMTPTYSASIETVRMIRKIAPKIVIIVGGPHPSALPQRTLEENPEIDIIVCGEGEFTMLELIQTISSGRSIESVKGIYYRKNGLSISTSSRAPIDDLDSLPFPARHMFPIDKYKTHPPYGMKNPYMSMISSRGCPFKCAYCSKSIFGNKLRMRSPKNVVDEIAYLIKEYGIKEIHFYDDDFTINMNRAEEICDEIIKREIKIIWSCTTRVDLVNQNLLKKMKSAGCWLISYGVESSRQELLDLIGKGITIEQVKSAIKWTKDARIKILGFFMIGLPGETIESINETIQFSKELDFDITNWSLTTIFPGTPLEELVKKRALKKGKIIPYTSGHHDLYRLPLKQNPVFIYEENLSVDELNLSIKRAYREFYLRPKYMLRQIYQINSISELVYYSRVGFTMLKWLLT